MMFYDGGFQYLPSFDHLIINFPVQRTAELMIVMINHYIDIPFFSAKATTGAAQASALRWSRQSRSWNSSCQACWLPASCQKVGLYHYSRGFHNFSSMSSSLSSFYLINQLYSQFLLPWLTIQIIIIIVIIIAVIISSVSLPFQFSQLSYYAWQTNESRCLLIKTVLFSFKTVRRQTSLRHSSHTYYTNKHANTQAHKHTSTQTHKHTSTSI